MLRLSAIVTVLLFRRLEWWWASMIMAGSSACSYGYSPAEVIVCDTVAGGIPDFTCRRKKDHSSRRFLFILALVAAFCI